MINTIYQKCRRNQAPAKMSPPRMARSVRPFRRLNSSSPVKLLKACRAFLSLSSFVCSWGESGCWRHCLAAADRSKASITLRPSVFSSVVFVMDLTCRLFVRRCISRCATLHFGCVGSRPFQPRRVLSRARSGVSSERVGFRRSLVRLCPQRCRL